jgi:hypothetical protein
MSAWDPQDVIDALEATLNDADIATVTMMFGEMPQPCVHIMPPALDVDPTGEGFTVPASTWPLILWYRGPSGDLDTIGELQFALAVLAAIADPSTVPDANFTGWLPGESEPPIIVETTRQGGETRMFSMTRTIPLTVHHT